MTEQPASVSDEQSPLAQLHDLRVRLDDDASQTRRPWDVLVAEGHATRHGLVALAVTMSQRSGDSLLDAATAGVDVLSQYDADPMRESVVAALKRAYPNAWGDLELDQIVDRLASMDPARARGVLNGIQGAALELRVAEMAELGDLQMPEGATHFELAGNHDAAIDGWFVDDDGAIVEAMQIKASSTAAPIAGHLANHPDVDLVHANVEAAQAAADAGIDGVVDTGVELSDVIPGGGTADTLAETLGELTDSVGEQVGEFLDELPLVALAVIGAQAVWRVRRGEDRADVLEQSKQRATSVLAWSGAGFAVGAATGSELARMAVVVGGKSGAAILRTFDRVVEPSTAHLRSLREMIAAPSPTPTFA